MTDTSHLPAEGYYNVQAVEGSGEVSFSQEKGCFSVGMLVNILDLGLQEVTYLSFDEKNMQSSNDVLQSLGCTNFETLEGIGKNVVQARIQHSPYTTKNGETKMGIKVWLQSQRTIFKTINPDDRRAFAAMMRQVGAQLPGGGGAGATAGPQGYPQNWDAPPQGGQGAPQQGQQRPGFKL